MGCCWNSVSIQHHPGKIQTAELFQNSIREPTARLPCSHPDQQWLQDAEASPRFRADGFDHTVHCPYCSSGTTTLHEALRIIEDLSQLHHWKAHLVWKGGSKNGQGKGIQARRTENEVSKTSRRLGIAVEPSSTFRPRCTIFRAGANPPHVAVHPHGESRRCEFSWLEGPMQASRGRSWKVSLWFALPKRVPTKWLHPPLGKPTPQR